MVQVVLELEKCESTINEAFVLFLEKCWLITKTSENIFQYITISNYSPLYVSPSATDVSVIVAIESTVVVESVLIYAMGLRRYLTKRVYTK